MAVRLCLWPVWLVLALCVLTGRVAAAEVIPPKPNRYVNDYAGVLSNDVEQRLNSQLEALEKSDSTQIIVALFQKMQSDSSIEDYTVRVAESWGVGGKTNDNGAVLFIFVQDRKLFIQVGYGLEGAIPDAAAKSINDSQITPHFRNNDYNAGVAAGVSALVQAARGEYTGTGQTVAQRGSRQDRNSFLPFIIFVIIFLVVGSTRRRRGYAYGRSGRSVAGPIFWGGGGWGGGGGFGGFSGGGFSGGGGSFGGGGAGGSW